MKKNLILLAFFAVVLFVISCSDNFGSDGVDFYRVSFDVRGGVENFETKIVKSGENIILPTSVREGFNFDGWFSNALEGQKLGDGGDKYTITQRITLFAQWTIKTYNIIWNINGGSPSPTQTTIQHGGNISAPVAMTRNGFAFGGWYRDSDFNTAAEFPIENITSDARFYARWIEIFTVNFNANGGIVNLLSQPVNSGTSITLPIPTRDGFVFNGWFTAMTGGTEVNSPFTVNANTTLFARWTIQNYTITFNSQGGSNVSPITRAVGSSITLPSPTRNGFTFDGWFTEASDGTRIASPHTITEDITVFAQWTAIPTFTITFNSQGGAEHAPITREVNTNINLPNPTRAGFTFNGWFTEASGETRIFSPHTITENITLFAQWTAIPTFTITFNSQGGTEYSPITREVNTRITLPNPTRDGYTFMGWYSIETGGIRYGGGTDNFTITEDLIMFAQWAKNFTITFNSQEGSNVASITRAENTSITLSNSTRSGFTFNGWFTEASGGTRVSSPHTIIENITLFAQWTINFTITFNSQGGTNAGSITRASGTQITLPTPTRSGHILSGWFSTPSGGTRFGSGGSFYTVNGDITMFAQWNPERDSRLVNATGEAWVQSGTIEPISGSISNWAQGFVFFADGRFLQIAFNRSAGGWVIRSSGSWRTFNNQIILSAQLNGGYFGGDVVNYRWISANVVELQDVDQTIPLWARTWNHTRIKIPGVIFEQ
ncbi:MAG: InlB B-repeat-containing protein [Chitinivibrionia bacterium]|nr:InlB B-repeat-containing protein [Chitinivibrionia bacterium]